jgi:hypothetical protein
VLNVLAVVLSPLVALAGIFVGFVLSPRRENRNMRRELALQRYREGQELFDELISAAGKRFIALQRWLRAVEDPAAYAGLHVREEYFGLVQQWNASTWSFRARLRIHLGDDTAVRFLDADSAVERRRSPLSAPWGQWTSTIVAWSRSA